MKRIALALALAGLFGCAHQTGPVHPTSAAPMPAMSAPPPSEEAMARALMEARAREQAQQRESADARAVAERQAAMAMQAEQHRQANAEASAKPAARPVPAPVPAGRPAIVPAPVATQASVEGASTGTEVVDGILSQLTLGNVAFNAPQSINIAETVSIHVALSPSESEAALRERVEGPGAKVSSALQVANNMEARLSGEGFKIVPVTRERQAVSSGVTEWIWDVTPLREGKHQLTLTIDALIDVNGQTIPKTLRTFRKPIEVEVTATQRVGGWLSEHGKWAWTTLLVPLLGWAAKKRKAKAQVPGQNNGTKGAA